MMRHEMSDSSTSTTRGSLIRYPSTTVHSSWFDVSMLHDFNITLSHVTGTNGSHEYIINASLTSFGQGNRYYIAKSYSSIRAFRRAVTRAVALKSSQNSCSCQGIECPFTNAYAKYLASHKLNCIEFLGFGLVGSSERKKFEVASFMNAITTAMHSVEKSFWSNQCQFLKLIAFFFETVAQTSTKTMKMAQSRNLSLSLKGWHRDRTQNYGVGITYD